MKYLTGLRSFIYFFILFYFILFYICHIELILQDCIIYRAGKATKKSSKLNVILSD